MKFGLDGDDIKRIVGEELGPDHDYDVDGLVERFEKKKAANIMRSKQKYWYADILFWLGLAIMLGGLFGGLVLFTYTEWGQGQGSLFVSCLIIISLIVGIFLFASGFSLGVGSEHGLYGDDDSGY